MEGFLGKYTIMENAAGITISDGGTPLIDTAGNREKNIQKDGTGKKILYEVYQFKDVDATQATATVDDNNRYAGRSKAKLSSSKVPCFDFHAAQAFPLFSKPPSPR